MLNPQVAEARLKEFSTADPREKQIARVKKLPTASRVAALALLGLKPDGTAFVTADYNNYALRNQQQAEEQKARESAHAFLDNASDHDREALFAAFLPGIAPVIAKWWMPDGATLYMGGYNRRPFRLPSGSGRAYEVRQGRQAMLHQLLHGLASYQEMPIDWFAAWAAYLGPYNADLFGRLFGAVIEAGGSDADAVFEILIASARGDHEIGAMGRHVTRGLLASPRPEGWEYMEKTLLAAQRQEGLRQSILEVADEAHPQAFRRMLKVIRENDLFRFSSVIRAADVWFGMNWVAYEKLSVKQANAATETVETFLSDPRGRDEILATATDGQVIYLALWSMAFDDAQAALQAAVPLLADPVLTRRYAALHLLVELRLDDAKPAILAAFDDADLRMAQKAFAHSNWYENKAREGSQEAFAEALNQEHSELTDVLETQVEPGTSFASWLSGFKEAMASTAAIIKGHSADAASKEKAAKTVEVVAEVDDRFDRLTRNLPRFPANAKVLEPVIWDWDRLTAHAENLADALPRVIGARPLEDLFPYLKQMSSYGRSQVADKIGASKTKSPSMREVLFDMAGDTASQVRANAFKAFNMDGWQLEGDEATKIEALLTRKAADLRKSALSLLLRQEDDVLLESAARLTGAKDANQRLAGLDVLTQMVDKKRAVDKARVVVAQFQTARADKVTDAEKGMLATLTNEAHEKPTLDNALGLVDHDKRTWATRPPVWKRFVYATKSAEAIVGGLNGFVEQYKELPVGIGDEDDNTITLLGNSAVVWKFPRPDYALTPEADAERCPVRAELAAWWDARPREARDNDGWELLRTDLAIKAKTENGWGGKMDASAWAVVEPLYSPIPLYVPLVPILLSWLQRLYPPQDNFVDFYLDGAGAVMVRMAEYKTIYERFVWGANSRGLAYLHAARNHHAQNGDTWTSEQVRRLWTMLRWLDEPSREIKGRNRLATIDDVAAAFRIGAATEADVYEQFLHPAVNNYGAFNDLRELSGRKATPLMEKTPALRPLVDACRKRVLEVELTRGDTETAASLPARALRYSGGMDILLKLVAGLGKDTFARGYSYYGETNRSNVFSHLIRVTFPGEGETPDAFAKAAKAAKITEKRLIETAMYAPQWTRHVEKALEWDGFTEAVWWLHAHTKDNSWSVEAEIKEAWTTEIADKTPLTAEDLTEGAVDVAWFGRVYETLGEERWKQVDEAAKFASSAGGHKRAQLFAEAMLNRVDRAELSARIKDKRHQDSLRALGLIPLPPKKDAATFEAELLSRYQTMQEFVRTSKQFGAQRQESEKLATRIGMENLARTAGYADPNRLTWAMEAAAVADLKDGPVTITVTEVSVSLAINGLGLPELTVIKKNKELANIPPAVKKEPEIAELVARKTDLTRQVSRMRESLESAMCRGDRFTGAEIGQLLDHPILRPLLQNLVFIEDEGREPTFGYPTGDGKMEGFDGSAHKIGAATAFRIAHPFDLLQSGKWEHWQKDCFLRERVQPFKQVFRELYVPTDAETADGTKSQRYAGHQVNPKQALALFNKRGWVGGGEYDYDSGGPRKTFHEAGYTVGVGFQGYSATPADVEGSTVETVVFTKKGDWKSVALKSVPPRVFSEAMRDLDLVVSVAHVGGVDPEASQSTVEMREALVREAMGLLKIENVRFEKTHAIVDGKLATYNVHLGSAIVHRQPGGYLCIVPVHSQHRGRLFLPFVDDDPRSAEVVSKVLLLARDNEIKDPTILEQILQVR